MTIIKSILIAFAMYSKIPLPMIDWDKRYMKYAICFFPLVGSIIGLIIFAFWKLQSFLNIGVFFRSVIILLIPILVTGGIHLDGFMDTMDAINSYQPKEKKLEILSDPHLGAFSVITFIVYILLMLAFLTEINNIDYIITLCFTYTLSRGLSGYAATTLKNAKSEGLLYAFTSDLDAKKAKIILIFFIIAPIVCICFVNLFLSIFILIWSISFFFIYKRKAYKHFGGITGDLEGWYLCINEIMFIIIIAAFEIGGF